MIGDAGKNVGEPGVGIDAVDLGGLCRMANYAEQTRFHQSLC